MKNPFKKRSQTVDSNTNQSKTSIETADLCIPIYLNQQVVFDMLAVLDDGFSQLSTIKISSGDTETSKSGMGASIGVSNVFALLGVSFSGGKSKEKGIQSQAEVSQERVHTPTSLFAKLKLRLRENDLLKKLDTVELLNNISSGEFVEFSATLRKNPLVDTIETLKKVMELATTFADDNTSTSSQKHKGPKPQNPNTALTKQMDGILAALNQSSSIELIGELLHAEGVTSVITARPEYFTKGNLLDIIDGEFHVLGKVTHVVKTDADEPINLLRKTAFGNMDQKLFESFPAALANMDQAGVHLPPFVTQIKEPALLIIPIAIYV